MEDEIREKKFEYYIPFEEMKKVLATDIIFLGISGIVDIFTGGLFSKFVDGAKTIKDINELCSTNHIVVLTKYRNLNAERNFNESIERLFGK